MIGDKRQNKIIELLIVVACFMSNISQLPFFVTSGRTQIICFPIWVILFIYLLMVSNFKINRQILSVLCPFCAFFSIIILAALLTGNKYLSSSMVYSASISIFIYIIGVLASPYYDESLLDKIAWAYCISALIVSWSIFEQYFGFGYSLNSRVYAYASKNSVSQILFTAIVLLFLRIHPNNLIQGVLKSLVLAFEVTMVVLLRSRATILGLLVGVLIVVLSRNSNRKQKIFISVLIVAVMILLFVNDSFYDMIFNNVLFAGRNVGDLDNLSSGRITILRSFPVLLDDHILFGIGATYFECFPLSAILQFGFIAGSILIGVAFSPLISSIKKHKSETWYVLLIIASAYSLNSLFEGLAPFGPGIKCYFMWLMYGMLICSKDPNCYRTIEQDDVHTESTLHDRRIERG